MVVSKETLFSGWFLWKRVSRIKVEVMHRLQALIVAGNLERVRWRERRRAELAVVAKGIGSEKEARSPCCYLSAN